MHPNKITLVVVLDFEKMIEQGFLDDTLAKKTQIIMIGNLEFTMAEYKELCQSRPFGFVDYIPRKLNTNLLPVKIVLCYYDSAESKIDALIRDFSQSH